MFTGIVRERGTVISVEGGEDGVRLRIAAPQAAAEAAVGDSIALSGVCLTVVAVDDGEVEFDAVAETLRRSSLGGLEPGAGVNVEPEGESRRVSFDAPADVLRYCVEKGSIAVEGVALTLTEIDGTGFAVALVPHTLAETTLGGLQPGDEVNLEVDVLAKYVERLVRRD